MKTIKLICILLIATILMPSCATLFSGTKQSVTFQSTPPNATVTLVMKKGAEQVIGETPCTVEISKKTREVKFSKDGYYTETSKIKADAKISGWYWADIGSIVLLGIGFIPTAIDLINGSYIVYPSQVNVELKKK